MLAASLCFPTELNLSRGNEDGKGLKLHGFLTFAVCGLGGALGVGGCVEGALPAAGLAPLRLVEPDRAGDALTDVALPVMTALTWN